jgi:ribosomal protein S27E
VFEDSSLTSTERHFAFEPTPAVAASRGRMRYVSCPVCDASRAEYLFHRVGVRFVRCPSCGLVYVSPVGGAGANYFDIERTAQLTARDRGLLERDFENFLELLSARLSAVSHVTLERVLLLGRSLPGFATSPVARRVGLELVPLSDAAFERLALDGSLEFARDALARRPGAVILHELFEACADPGALLAELKRELPVGTPIVVTYANVDSLPARLLRRYWPAFFDLKRAFFSTSNLALLMGKQGYSLRAQFGFPTTRSAGYVFERFSSRSAAARLQGLRAVSVPLRTGHQVGIFATREEASAPREKLSIILPVFNEARYVADVLDALLRKELSIDRELIVVESNSQDGTREIVQRYEGRAGVRTIYEDRPRGKGHAVKAGLAAATGSILLIQDADFEYDLDDYESLLEPILQKRAHFVLGSRSLGLDDWKVRRFAHGAFKGLLMNIAQVGFAKTYNLLYQQRATDVNTMFKVFRRECLEGIELESDGFDLDIELACKLAKNGHAPLEVPVNYVSRGFDEGKKIRFLRDALPSYVAFFRYRFR